MNKINALEDIANLWGCINDATPEEFAEGMNWYQVANSDAKRIADETGIDLPVVCAVLGATSVRCKWHFNLGNAEAMCRAYVNGFDPFDVTINTFDGQKRMAANILEAGDPTLLTGPKVSVFARVICDPSTTEVVVDSHAYNAYLNTLAIKGGKGPRVTDARIKRTAAAYTEVADTLGILPQQAQAIVWVVWKRRHNL